MTLKMTERDKKLLVFLAIFLIVVGGGAGIIFPLMNKSQELSEQLAEARIEQTEKEMKVQTVSALKEKNQALKEDLTNTQQEFYGILPSMEIDKSLTARALAHGVTVIDMDISQPVIGEYAALIDYQTMLKQQLMQSMEEDTGEEAEPAVYSGIYTAKVQMAMTGSRGALQAMLDDCAALEPKLRIAEFLWQKNTRDGADVYTLSLSMELYMCDTVEQYITDQKAQEAVKEETAGEDTAEDAETNIEE